MARVEFPREEIDAAFRISLTSRRSASHLLQPPDLGQLLTRGATALTLVDLGLAHPLARCLWADPSLGPNAWATAHAEPTAAFAGAAPSPTAAAQSPVRDVDQFRERSESRLRRG